MSEAFWDRIFAAVRSEDVVYDSWLEPYLEALRGIHAKGPILDLGCGAGGSSIYLSERGFEVIACDRSQEALQRVGERLPSVSRVRLDLQEPLPFGDGFASAVVADLCLHYFDWSTTIRIVNELRRVLIPGGMALCRVNSSLDTAYGAGRGLELEPGYYEWEGQRKRFFDREQAECMFEGWRIAACEEQQMLRYAKLKHVWMLAAYKK